MGMEDNHLNEDEIDFLLRYKAAIDAQLKEIYAAGPVHRDHLIAELCMYHFTLGQQFIKETLSEADAQLWRNHVLGEEEEGDKWVIVTGNPFDGLKISPTFSLAEDAIETAENLFRSGECWWVVKLGPKE